MADNRRERWIEVVRADNRRERWIEVVRADNRRERRAEVAEEGRIVSAIDKFLVRQVDRIRAPLVALPAG